MQAHAGDIETLLSEIKACRLCADRFAATATSHAPRPVAWLSDAAPILIAGQAPGARVHASGVPFDDPSGDRLRDWLGVDRETFYDRRLFAIAPMAFCFPGYDAKGTDLPPPNICAKTWRGRALSLMPQVQLTLWVGGYAQKWALPGSGNVTETVRAWRDLAPSGFPLPHPSWRNTAWLKKNLWFERDLLPKLRSTVATILQEQIS